MVITIKKRTVFLNTGLLALALLIWTCVNAMAAGNWSTIEIIVVVSAALILAGSVVFIYRTTGDFSIKLANLALAFFSFLCALVLVEILANVYLWEFAKPEQFNQYASANQLRKRYGQGFFDAGGIAPHRYIGYIPASNFETDLNKHNSLGFRGDEIEQPKPEGVFRIACIGGSTTYSGLEDYTLSYPYLLQEYLQQAGYTQIEVINAGMVGYMSWESLVNLEFRVLDLEPDLLIIYHAINDVYARIVWPPDAYRGDNSGARTLRLQPVKMPPIWEYSTVLRMAAITQGISQPHSAVDWQFHDYPQTAYGDIFLKQKETDTYPSEIFDDVPAATMLQENQPIYFERNLTNMVGVAQIHDIDVVLLTFAYARFSNPRVGSPEFQTGIAEGNEVVKQVAAATGAHLYDFASAMPTNMQYYTDGHHFSESGNALRAALIGDYLIENGLLPE